MKTETLVVTVDRDEYDLAERMNIQTDALIGNQCHRVSTEVLEQAGKKIVYLNRRERGVGRNRNLLLENASADICILADDDMRFVDGYRQIAEKAFEECPDADILVFNLIEKYPKRYVNKKKIRIKWHNYAKYGAARLVVRRRSIVGAGIKFSVLFGGGARYGSGEDTIFLKECLRKGLKIYAVPYALAEIDQEVSSTWFNGYNDKFFCDKGALYACLYPWGWSIFSIRFLIRRYKKYAESMSFARALRDMLAGGREFQGEMETDDEI